MKRLICILFAAGLCLSAAAQFPMEKFPNYKDFSIPKPDRSTQLSKDELKLTDKFLPLYPKGIPIASQEELYKLYDFFRSNPDGQKEWKGLQSTATRMVSNWDIRNGGFGSSRYIYSLGSLKNLALVYIFSGNELVSLFIRGHLAKIADLPIYFWIHSELRGYDPKKPKGCLETAALNQMLGTALAAVGKDMSPEEYKKIEDAWHEYGHKTARNWLDTFRPNNWTAVISCGLLYSATYFKDEACRQHALKGLKYYADTTVEPDGSYSEGYGYFDYPIGQLTVAAMVMTPEEIRETFGDSHLKDSQRWRVYGHLFDVEENGDPGVMRISFGDNPYGDRVLFYTDTPSYFSKLIYRDGVAAWLRQKYGSRANIYELLLAERLGVTDVEPQSPAEAGLPLARAFDSGDCYIRSDWNDEGIVLALKAGDCGKRVGYSHTRPELNSIALGAFGEYLIVTSGAASYRSRIYNEYDMCTRSANNIAIDGKNQKCPRNPMFKEGRWDNRDVWVKGYPHAIVRRCENLPDGGAILSSDASDCYHIDMKEALRTVQFIPEGGFFIVRDRMVPADGQVHDYDYRLHIFNRDGKTAISGKPGLVTVQRPKADLYIALKGDAKVKLVQEDGYMHHPIGRDYDENGPKQGKPGSAIILDYKAKAPAWNVCAVLYPKPSGAKAPKIKWSGNQVIVDGKKYDIPE
ncbi:MAG: heparinase II/III family protein [Bacteroidales bacterium]|nr:heparinase II/III family protein [Bacteroidales bacterium]